MNKLIQEKTSSPLLGLLSIFLFSISILFLSFYSALIPDYQSFNIGIFISIIIYNLFYALIIIRDKDISYILFSPLFWYKFVSTLFYGIGPLSYYFGNSIIRN